MTTFVLDLDYRWRDDPLPWWARLPVARDYAVQAQLLRDFVFELDGKRYTIRAGYRWNGVSAGMPFSRRDDHRVMRASLVHDWIYHRRPKGVTQEMADALFLRHIKEDGAPRWFQWLADSWLAHRLYRWAWERGGIT